MISASHYNNADTSVFNNVAILPIATIKRLSVITQVVVTYIIILVFPIWYKLSYGVLKLKKFKCTW